MPKLEPYQRMERAMERIQEHLPQLAAEILEMRNTAVLRQGLVREIAQDLDMDRSLSLIESMVLHACLERTAHGVVL